jgi:protein-S-isoprenylcysteine O-methyltransferase Ste14
MNQIALQVILAVVSWIGIPVAWVSGYRGRRRIRQPFAGVVTQMGVLIMIAPWVIMPLLAQPRFVGSLRTWVFAVGVFLLAAALLLVIWAIRFIFPAAAKGGDELDPEFLVVKGPYQWVRHPSYLATVAGIIGWVLLKGGLYSIVLCPISYLLLRFEAYLEESRVLEPKFGDEFRRFRERVPTAIFGRIGTVILTLAYLVLVSLVALGKVTTG